MEAFLSLVRAHVETQAPDLLFLVDIYAAEARFGHDLLRTELSRLRPGASVLEVGAGALLLRCQLQREGFEVAALEPLGDGFSHFDRLRQMVLEVAGQEGCVHHLMDCPAESLSEQEKYDLSYSINVMEHVNSVDEVLGRVYSALKKGAVYRFICPNYTFPYEPHFNIPTLGSKSLTEKYLGRWILKSKKVMDPVGTWRSLNWISVKAVRKICRERLNVEPKFDRGLLETFLRRALSDPLFQSRKGAWVYFLLNGLCGMGLLGMTRWVPPGASPVMDCTITHA
jgi:SAM-dependent methyltransferase